MSKFQEGFFSPCQAQIRDRGIPGENSRRDILNNSLIRNDMVKRKINTIIQKKIPGIPGKFRFLEKSKVGSEQRSTIISGRHRSPGGKLYIVPLKDQDERKPQYIIKFKRGAVERGSSRETLSNGAQKVSSKTPLQIYPEHPSSSLFKFPVPVPRVAESCKSSLNIPISDIYKKRISPSEHHPPVFEQINMESNKEMFPRRDCSFCRGIKQKIPPQMIPNLGRGLIPLLKRINALSLGRGVGSRSNTNPRFRVNKNKSGCPIINTNTNRSINVGRFRSKTPHNNSSKPTIDLEEGEYSGYEGCSKQELGRTKKVVSKSSLGIVSPHGDVGLRSISPFAYKMLSENYPMSYINFPLSHLDNYKERNNNHGEFSTSYMKILNENKKLMEDVNRDLYKGSDRLGSRQKDRVLNNISNQFTEPLITFTNPILNDKIHLKQPTVLYSRENMPETLCSNIFVEIPKGCATTNITTRNKDEYPNIRFSTDNIQSIIKNPTTKQLKTLSPKSVISKKIKQVLYSPGEKHNRTGYLVSEKETMDGGEIDLWSSLSEEGEGLDFPYTDLRGELTAVYKEDNPTKILRSPIRRWNQTNKSKRTVNNNNNNNNVNR